jgi:hypothetical protein
MPDGSSQVFLLPKRKEKRSLQRRCCSPPASALSMSLKKTENDLLESTEEASDPVLSIDERREGNTQ